MLVVLVMYTFVWIASASNHSQMKLHRFMDAEELKFYFGRITNLPDYEIVDFPENLMNNRQNVINGDAAQVDGGEKYVNFKVFNKQVHLNLYPNKHLISPHAKFVRKTVNGTEKMMSEGGSHSFCHYLHVDSVSTAAISNCIPNEIRGLVFLQSDTLEIVPISQLRLKTILNKNRESLVAATKDGYAITTVPHLIKRSLFGEGNFEEDFLVSSLRGKNKPTQPRGVNFDQPTVELGLFFDEAFYKFFAPFFEYDVPKLRNFILSYLNGVQSLYYHQSLGKKIDFTIVYLEIMEEQPAEMPHAYGERNALIDSFCAYQKALNKGDDRNAEHWDMAIYVSGLDFFAWDSKGNKNGVTMGLATVGGVCNDDYNCIIVEFGSINQFGKPYPSSGFTAVYILAHEIGHNLGMSHDGTGNHCNREGFVMSPTRGTQGETTWSSCSASIVQKLDWAKCLFDTPSMPPNDLDPWKFSGYPGISFTAKDQCEILLRDREASVFFNGHQSTICDNLHCRTPKRPGFFFAGPALSGTDCGNDKWCDGGTCVSKRSLIRTTTNAPKKPTWGPWRETQCSSECIMFGKGFQKKRRFCSVPNNSCNGASSSFALCDDSKVCATRTSVVHHATQKCKEFSQKLPSIDGEAVGLQASYESFKLWMPCAIFCRRMNTSSYFTPREELNELGINPYFPDGTLCHKEGSEKYYCIQHHCLPETTMLTKSSNYRTVYEQQNSVKTPSKPLSSLDNRFDQN